MAEIFTPLGCNDMVPLKDDLGIPQEGVTPHASLFKGRQILFPSIQFS